MRNDVIIGLDISPSHMGWSVWSNGRMVGCGYSRMGGWHDASLVAEQIALAVGLSADVRLVVEETMPHGRNTGGMTVVSATGKAIGRVLQAVERQMAREGCVLAPAEYITVHEWRRGLWPHVGKPEGMDRRAWKAKAIAHCDEHHWGWRQMFDAGARLRREDVAEAICIGEYAVRKEGRQ